MKKIRNFFISLRTKMQEKKLNAWQIGGLLVVYNTFIIVAFGLLAVVSFSFMPLWVYVFFLSPFFFFAFWLWFSQRVLFFYHRISLHESIIIAKVSVLPFVLIFLFSLVFLLFSLTTVTPDSWKALSYYGAFFGSGSAVIAFPILVFGFTHHIRKILSKKK